ncbi:MAG: hypothetical protein ACRDQ5_20830 [Sciscionella sp.]
MEDAEDGLEPVGAGDGDLGDEGFDQGFGLVVAALGDHTADMVGNLGERGGIGRGGSVVQVGGEVVTAGAELLEPCS